MNARYSSSSETQGRSVRREKRRDESFQAQAEKPLSYRLSPDHFQTIKRMLAPDWAQKIGEQHPLSSFREFVHDGH